MPRGEYVSDNKLFVIGTTIGMAYGLAVRFGSKLLPNSHAFTVMTLGFMVCVPLAIGFITVFVVERKEPQGYAVWFFLPWIPILGATLGSMLALWEGAICAVLFMPIAVAAGSIGGALGGLIARSGTSAQSKNIFAGCVLFLPLLVSSIEPRFLLSKEIRTVETSTIVQASPLVVWRNIERVRAIESDELSPSWSRGIGFPAPIEATLLTRRPRRSAARYFRGWCPVY